MGRCAEVRGQVPTAVLSFYHVGGSFRQTQVLTPGSKQDCVLSHLVDPLQHYSSWVSWPLTLFSLTSPSSLLLYLPPSFPSIHVFFLFLLMSWPALPRKLTFHPCACLVPYIWDIFLAVSLLIILWTSTSPLPSILRAVSVKVFASTHTCGCYSSCNYQSRFHLPILQTTVWKCLEWQLSY